MAAGLHVVSSLYVVLRATSIAAQIINKTVQTARPGGGRSGSSLTWAINCWSDDEITAWKAAFIANCNSIAVASAIFASIGLSSLQLPGIDDTHWTARAFLITSMSLGILSTVYATAQQAEVAMLIEPLSLRIYLSRGRNNLRSIKEHIAVSSTLNEPVGVGKSKHQAVPEQKQDDSGTVKDSQRTAKASTSHHIDQSLSGSLKKADISKLLPIEGSIAMEVRSHLPQGLLYVAVLTYFVGFGLYLLFLWLRKVGDDGTTHMKVFIFFIVVVSAFLLRILFMSFVQVLDSARRDLDFDEAGSTALNNRAILDAWLGKLKDLRLQEVNKDGTGRGSGQILQEIAVLVKEWEANSPTKHRAVAIDIVTDIYMLSLFHLPKQLTERFKHKADDNQAQA